MRIRFRRVALVCAWLAVSWLALDWRSNPAAQEGGGDESSSGSGGDDFRGPELIAYSGEEFDGHCLRVRGTLLDMPEEPAEGEGTADEASYDWNDQISSIVVVRGTWRLYQNGRCNTELDETPLEELDVATKQAVGGWSCVVSAGANGPARVTFRDGLFADDQISSIELVSERALAAPDRRPAKTEAPEIEVFWDTHFGGRSLVLTKSTGELPAFTTEAGETLSWDENISSVVVRAGTWRLCEQPTFNREAGGWSVVVSAPGHGALRHSASECGGWTNDGISSIQLVSGTVMEEWASLNREAHER